MDHFAEDGGFYVAWSQNRSASAKGTIGYSLRPGVFALAPIEFDDQPLLARVVSAPRSASSSLSTERWHRPSSMQ